MIAPARIGHLHVRLRGAGGEAPPVRARAEAVARELLPLPLAAGIAAADRDGRVHVLRSVRTVMADADGDEALAREWGDRIAAAVSRTLRAADPDEVVSFADEPAYVASFLRDLSRGLAAGRWYYGAFRDLMSMPLADAVRILLGRDPVVGAAALGSLEADGDLAALVAALGDRGCVDALRGLRGAPAAGASAEALVAIARGLAERMGLEVRPGTVAGPPERAAAARVDWGSGRSVTDGLVAVLRALMARGAVRRPLAQTAAAVRRRAQEACAGLDWAERPRLEVALAAVATGAAAPGAACPSAPEAIRDLAADLLAVLRAEAREAAPAHSAPARALRLLAALVARDSRWAGDPAAAAAADALARLEGVPAADAVARAVAAAGAGPAVAPAPADGAPSGAASACAGVLLLARGIADAGLHRLGARGGYPSGVGPDAVPALLAGVAGAWAGAGALGPDGALDPAVAVLCGYRDAGAAWLVEAWGAAGREAHLRAQESALAGLAAARALPDDAPEIVTADPPGGTRAVVVRHAASGLCLLGDVPEPGERTADVVTVLRAALERATGARVDRVARSAAVPLDPHPVLGATAGGLAASVLAGGVLRAWARWLRGFDGARADFLLERFVRRPGTVAWDDAEIRVELEPGPLDVVLHLSGYLDPFDGGEWLGGRRLVFGGASP